MKKIILLLAFHFVYGFAFGQEQIIQTFAETNINGITGFGAVVSNSGDLNNDGFDDVIIGAEQYSFGSGRVYVYFGGTPMDSSPALVMTGETEQSFFGRSISAAGDLNNDGYDDIIIGEPGYSPLMGTGHGRAYIYLGGELMDNTPDVIIDSEDRYNYLGQRVSGAGDINGDGYDDVIVSATGYNANTGRVYVFLGGSSMDNIADFTMDGEDSVNNYGYAISNAGDLNNDSYDDIVVGAFGDYNTAGKSYIYYGGASMDSTPNIAIDGENNNDHFGISVSSAGDINFDGYADIIIGAELADSSKGRAYVYFGDATMDNIPDLVLEAEDKHSYFGVSVSEAGDINFDGFDDVMVAAHAFNNVTGRVSVYFGGRDVNNVVDLVLDGEESLDYFGNSISSAGDLNNDNYDDIIVGAFGHNSNNGRTYIFYGKTGIDDKFTPLDKIIFNGEGTENNFGISVANAGDVNDDDYDDIIVGANQYNFGTGRAYLYFGSDSMDNVPDIIMEGEATKNHFGISVATAGDVNNDGFDDVIVGASARNNSKGKIYIYFGGNEMDNQADFVAEGEDSYSIFGSSVSTAGDLNNDSFSDVIVGSYGYNDRGRAYIFFGSDSMSNAPYLKLLGGGVLGNYGRSVSSAGDVNYDGYDDVIVGADGYDYNTGRAYIYLGGDEMDSVPDITLEGEGENNFFGYSVAALGDVNKDSFSDVIVGAYGYNTTRTGRVYVYNGATNMDSTADMTFTGENGGDNFGYSISAGDINNDNFPDIIVGANEYNFDTGRIYVYYGNPLDDVADIIIDGEGLADYFGTSVSIAGDVDSDGFSDILIGAYNYPDNGKAYLYCDSLGSPPLGAHYDKPIEYSLAQNYPNPFNPSTIIRYEIIDTRFVSLKVFNSLGQEVATLVNQKQNAGRYDVEFNASNFTSGIYLYSLKTDEFVSVKKMLLLK